MTSRNDGRSGGKHATNQVQSKTCCQMPAGQSCNRALDSMAGVQGDTFTSPSTPGRFHSEAVVVSSRVDRDIRSQSAQRLTARREKASASRKRALQEQRHQRSAGLPEPERDAGREGNRLRHAQLDAGRPDRRLTFRRDRRANEHQRGYASNRSACLPTPFLRQTCGSPRRRHDKQHAALHRQRRSNRRRRANSACKAVGQSGTFQP